MSDPSQRSGPEDQRLHPEDNPQQGPNLILIYAMLALGLLLAIAVAAMIVGPFYLRR